MADKKISQLPNGEIFPETLLPIVSLGVTSKVTFDDVVEALNPYFSGATDTYVTGGTYSDGTAIFTNNVGGTFDVTGFSTGSTGTFLTGSTFENNTLSLIDNLGGVINTNIDNFTGLTVNGPLFSDTISATTYENLPLDIYITGSTFDNNVLTLTNNSGGTIETHIDNFTALTINNIEVSTVSATTYLNLPSDVAFSGTYMELKALIDNNELLVGKKYVLTDYKTVYQINGSDSSNNTQIHEIIGRTAQYTQFNSVPSDIAPVGSVVTCVYTPPGASIVTGQTFTIITYFNSAYIRFSPNPTANGGENFGAKFRFEKQRYPNIPSNAIINDTNGKPVIKPSGVLNTEVHDGGPYMSMTGLENPAPTTEKLVLTAIDTNKFSVYCESLTYIGDTLTYDFNDNIVYDANGNNIGLRNGNILKRTNVTNTISVNKDWRVQRYRRYGIDDVNFDGFLLKNTYNSGASGTTIYQIDGLNYSTARNTLTQDHKYFLREPYKANAYINFAKTSPNVFLSGVTTIPATNSRFSRPLEYSVDIVLPMSGLTGTTFAKDFHILPIVNNHETELTNKFIVGDLYDSVFLPYGQRYGNTFNLTVDSINGNIYYSTFTTLPNITNLGTFNNVVALDYLNSTNRNNISGINWLSNGDITNDGTINGVTFGSIAGATFLNPDGTQNINPFNGYRVDQSSSINYSIISGGYTRFALRNSNISACLIVKKQCDYSSLSLNSYLTLLKNRLDMFSTNINIISQNNPIPNKGYYGYIYDYSIRLKDIELNNLNYKKNLIENTIDINNITTITTISTVQ